MDAQSLYQIYLALVVIGVWLFAYFLPADIAYSRGHPHLIPILLVDLLLGWTLIGWVAALAWAAMPITASRPPRLTA